MPKLVACIAALGLFASAAVGAQERPLTADDVKDRWVGKAAIGSTTAGMAVELRLLADGSAAIVAGSTSDTGTWRLTPQGFCTTWKIIRAGQERCFTGIVQGTAVKVFNPDGSAAGQYSEFR